MDVAPLGASAAALAPVYQPASADVVAMYNQMVAGYQPAMFGSGGFSITNTDIPTYATYNPFGGYYGTGPSVMPTYGSDQILYNHYGVAQAQTGQAGTTTGGGTTPATTTTPPTTTATTTAAAPTPPAPPAATTPKKRKSTETQQKTGGQKTEAKADPKPAARKTVTVKSGDTLSKIAAAHGISWQKLYELNKGVIGGNPNLIRPGQVLKLPA
jgi:LysM repeat protein